MTQDMLSAVKAMPLPFSTLIGLEVTEANADRVCGRVLVRDELCTVPAILHGGAIMTIADTLGAIATALNLPQGAGTATIESKTNFLAPAPKGSVVTGTCEPIHRGRKTMVWQTRITRDDGRLVALVTQSQMVL